MSAACTIKLDSIWVRVPRLKPAIRYYSDLLGRPVVQELYDGELYVFHLPNGRKLLLDDIRQCDIREPLSRPAAILVTEHLRNLHDRAKGTDFAYVSDIEAGVNYPYFVCRDKDHNEYVFAERPFDYPGAEASNRSGPIEACLSGATVPVSDVRKAYAWMAKWLGPGSSPQTQNHTESSRFHLSDGSCLELVPKLEGVRHSAPLLRLKSADLPEAYRHIKAIGAHLITKPEEAALGRPILFTGPDGHTLSVELVR